MLFFAVRDELFINRSLLRMMPELVMMDHVHIDACMLVIYYCVLQQGSYFRADRSRSASSPRAARPSLRDLDSVYVSALRAVALWQHEATGSLTDFVAAVLMVGFLARV